MYTCLLFECESQWAVGGGRVGELLMMFGNFNSAPHTHTHMTTGSHTHAHTHVEDTFSIQLAAKRVSGSLTYTHTHTHTHYTSIHIHLASLSHRTRTLSNKHSNRSFFTRKGNSHMFPVFVAPAQTHTLTHAFVQRQTNKQTTTNK